MDGKMGEKGLIDQLDKLPKIRSFDAFPKTQANYTQRSAKGGVVTLLVGFCLLILAWNEARDYLYGKPGYTFSVDPHIEMGMQINLDMTVAMQCHYLTVDLRDAVGDRLHMSDVDVQKDGTTFEVGHAGRLDTYTDRKPGQGNVGKTIDASKKAGSSGGLSFGRDSRPIKQKLFKKTKHIIPDGPACRIYGSMTAKQVTGNLHVTTLGHGYFSWEHTDHALMNLSHVVHELSFGSYFPNIAQPLDHVVEVSPKHFAVFEYFVSVIPTRFIDRWGRKLITNQYSVNDYVREVRHGMGVPGIFIKYDIEPLTMTVHERTTTLTQFLVRLAGILGGVWVCAGFGYRIGDKMINVVSKKVSDNDGGAPSYEQYANSYSSSYLSSRSAHQAGGATFGQRSNASPGFASGFGNLFNGQAGLGHRPTQSVQQRIDSEEGRAPW